MNQVLGQHVDDDEPEPDEQITPPDERVSIQSTRKSGTGKNAQRPPIATTYRAAPAEIASYGGDPLDEIRSVSTLYGGNNQNANN